MKMTPSAVRQKTMRLRMVAGDELTAMLFPSLFLT
jgi:hypothetical protein